MKCDEEMMELLEDDEFLENFLWKHDELWVLLVEHILKHRLWAVSLGFALQEALRKEPQLSEAFEEYAKAEIEDRHAPAEPELI